MKYNLICFAAGVLLGLFLDLSYGTAVRYDNSLPVSTASTKKLQKEVARFETVNAKLFDSLKRQSAKLVLELHTTKSELWKAKQKSIALQGQVHSLLENQFERGQANNAVAVTTCDSLMVSMNELMQANAQKDTLYEQATSLLEEQVKNKDSTINLKEVQYAQLTSAFKSSVNNQTFLTEQNKLLSKEYKRQKLKSKFLSTAIFVLSGAAAAFLLHN